MRTRPFELALILLTSVAIGRSQPAPAAPAAADAPAAAVQPAAPAETAQGAETAAAAKPAEAAKGETPAATAAPAAPAQVETPAAAAPAAAAPAETTQKAEAPAAVNPAAPAAAAAPAAPAEAVQIQGTQPAAAGATRSKDTLSVDFPDEDIRTILRNVADLFELNLVIPDALQGKASIKLHDVTWHQIFDVVLTPVGFTYIDQAGIIKVVSLASLAEEPVATEIFTLNYARAADVQPAIVSLIESGKGGKLTVDTRSNSLIVTEHPSRLNKIRPIIKQLDLPTEQVMIESKFIEMSSTNVKNIGVNWTSLSGYGLTATGSSGATRGTSNTQTNADNDVGFMKNGYAQLANLVGVPSMGPTPTYTPLPWVKTPSSINDYSVSYPGGPSSTRTYTSSTTNTALFSPDTFKMVLSALKTLDQTKIVSNPTVVTLNNQEAVINVGEEDPIPNYQYNQATGTFEVSGFIYKPIGIILKVTPQVNASGFIKLTLSPEVSQKSGFANFGNAQIPIISERKATTQVTLKDGYTMGIGGLISSNGDKSSSKVPILGDIPLLGKLFQSKSNNEQKTNLVIFITAKTVNAEGASVSDVFDPRQLREMGMRREDLPGYRENSDPFLPPAADETKGKK